MHNSKKFVLLLLATMFSLPALAANGANNAYLNNSSAFELHPRLTLWGMTGDNTSVEAQALLPFSSAYDHAAFGIAEIAGVSETNRWMAALGFGYRKLIKDRIYGDYLIVDYNTTRNSNHFVVLNPGFESMGKKWDFDVNGYIPFGRQKVMDHGFASDFGDYSHVIFEGNNQYDFMANLVEEMGYGADFQVGHKLSPHTKAYLGGYYFDTKDVGSVTGGMFRVTHNINRYTSVEFVDTYDEHQHNRAFIGFRVSFGGYSDKEKDEFGMSTRLLEPIDHDLVTIAGTSIVGTKVGVAPEGDRILIHDNIQFFKPGGSGGDGTYESPYAWNKTNYNTLVGDDPSGSIDDKPLLYFAGGPGVTYSLSGFDGLTLSDRLKLQNGWGMYGRADSSYKAPAFGDDRPIFEGGVDVAAGSGTTRLESIQIENDVGGSNVFTAQPNAGLYLNGSGTVELQDACISNSDTSLGDLNVVGVYSSNSTLNFIGGSNIISAMTTGTNSSNVYGIYATLSTLNFSGGTNEITSELNYNGSSTSRTYGIYANVSTINFSGGINDVHATASGTGRNEVFSIYIPSLTTVNFTGGTNNLSTTVTGNGTGSYGRGIELFSFGKLNFSNGNNNIDVFADNTVGFSRADGISNRSASSIDFSGGNNNISATTNNSGSNLSSAQSIYTFIFGTANINIFDGQNSFYATATNLGTGSSLAYTISAYNHNGGDINLYDGTNTFSATASGLNGGVAYGINATNTDISLFDGTNTISAIANASVNNAASGIFVNNFAPRGINFVGGTNNILASAADGTSAAVYGVTTRRGSVNFAGGTNNISAQASGVNNSATQVYGVFINNTFNIISNFSGGTNTIIASANSSGTGINNTYGVYVKTSTINFNGANNFISATSNTTTTGFNRVYGIYGTINSNINFFTGTNSILATSSGNNLSDAYGIFSTFNSSLNFANSAGPKIIIGVGADNDATGILANLSSVIKIDSGGTPTTPTEILNRTNINRIFGSISGSMVFWNIPIILWP